MRNDGHLILKMSGKYAMVTFPGNPNVYGVLPENVIDFRTKYGSVLSWPTIRHKEEERDEIFFICMMYGNLKTQENPPQSTVESLFYQFKSCLEMITMDYASRFGFNVSSIKLNLNGRKTLGKCSMAGDISYNPILIEYGPTVIKEVILHELCHTVYHNHRRKFWALLEECLVGSGLTDIRGYVIPELFSLKNEYYIATPITSLYPKINTGFRKCQKNPDMFRRLSMKENSKKKKI